MSIFGDQLYRLLRDDWDSPRMLAEELFAMFSSTDPIEITSPVLIQGGGPDSPLTVRSLLPSVPPLSMQIKKDGDTIQIVVEDPLPEPTPPPLTSGQQGSSTVQQATIVSVGGDTLAVTSRGQQLQVAKPPLLRASLTSRGDTTYTYTSGSGQSRIADDGNSQTLESLDPPYLAGDTIFIAKTIDAVTFAQSAFAPLTGPVKYVDLNCDGRHWSTLATQSYPAQIVSKAGDGSYTCTVYTQGIDNDGTDTSGVIQLQIADDQTIPAGTWTVVDKVSWLDPASGELTSAYYMQVAVWLSGV